MALSAPLQVYKAGVMAGPFIFILETLRNPGNLKRFHEGQCLTLLFYS
jgi:hypothetical protein